MPTLSDLSVLDRRRARSRAALIGAAETLFAAKGLDAVTVDDIVATAEVAKGTFYNHFDDKDAIATHVAESVRTDVEAQVEATNAGVADPVERCARAICAYVRFAKLAPLRGRLLTRLHAGALRPDAAINRGVLRDIKAGRAAGSFKTTSNAVAVYFVAGATLSAMAAALEGEDAEKTARDIVTLALTGLGVRRDSARAIAQRAAFDVFSAEGRT